MVPNRRLGRYADEQSDTTQFEIGDMICETSVDADEEADPMVVVSVPGQRADEYEIDPLAGTTVFDYAETPDDVEPDEPVVEAVYVGTVLHYADRLPDGCTPMTAHEHVEAIEDSPATVYAYPESQVEPTE